MGKEIYLKNYRALKEGNKYIFDEINEYKNSEEEFEVYSYERENADAGLYLDFGNRGIVQLGSQYEPEKYAKAWADKWIDRNPFESNSIILCFGLGCGEYIKELYSRLGEENYLVVYEPSRKVLDVALRNVDFSEFDSDKLTIISGTSSGKQELLNLLRYMTNISYAALLRYYDLPNYPRIFKDEYENFRQMIFDAHNSMVMNINTVNNFSKIAYKNIIYSLGKALDAYSLNSLCEKLPEGKPAIIISAGPSLEKNIEELQRAKGKAFLIATDTALKPLLNHGIKPDIYVTIDPDKWLELFDNDEIKNIPVLALFKSKTEVVESNQSRIFYSYTDTVLWRILNKIDKEGVYSNIMSGGSVATTAFSFAINANMNPIVFVGQDLAYTGNKKHVSGAFKDDQTVSELTGNELYVEDINGEQILTNHSFNNFRLWFEKAIMENPKVRYIDATEGGAKIEGTELMDLKDFIDAECNDETDFEKLIFDTDLMFKDDIRRKYYDVLLSLEDEADEIQNKCELLLEAYKNIQVISQKDVIIKDEVVASFALIKKYTSYLDEAVLTALLDDYMSAEGIFSSMHDNKAYENVNEELADISKRAIFKIQSLIAGMKEIRPAIEDFVAGIQVRYNEEYNNDMK